MVKYVSIAQKVHAQYARFTLEGAGNIIWSRFFISSSGENLPLFKVPLPQRKYEGCHCWLLFENTSYLL